MRLRDASSRRRLVVVISCAVAVLLLAVVLTVAARRDGGRLHAGPSTATTLNDTTGSSPSTSSSSAGTTSSLTSTTQPATTTLPPGEPAVVVRRGDPNRSLVALTFDAGSDVGYASEILDTLAANGIKATFGMTGLWADRHPELVSRMARDGHQLVNHSYDHPSFTGRSTGTAPLSRSERIEQVARADTAIQAATGASTVPWFRPPYGDEDASVRADVGSAGYRYEVTWTVDSLGWKGISADAVVDRCLLAAQNGAIFLLHVGSASTDASALPRLIDGLRRAGYGFATVAGIL